MTPRPASCCRPPGWWGEPSGGCTTSPLTPTPSRPPTWSCCTASCAATRTTSGCSPRPPDIPGGCWSSATPATTPPAGWCSPHRTWSSGCSASGSGCSPTHRPSCSPCRGQPGSARRSPTAGPSGRWPGSSDDAAFGASSLACMVFSWDGSRQAFTDAAEWFVDTAARVGDRWSLPGLGEWDVRALVGHTSRSFLTVETYLARPAVAVDVASAMDYFRATRTAANDPAVAARGREAGTALGADPATAVAEIAARVLALVDTQDGTELMTTAAGGMRLGDYLPTRTFELAVHTADLATALGVPPDVPRTAAAQALHLVADLAATEGLAGPLLLAATGRPGLPAGFSVL